MKIVHIADTHLGFSAYRKISEQGYNQREEDISAAFAAAIEKIIEIHPDLVLHCGDLFDSARPTNRIISFAIEQILKLINKKIKVIIISGNHDSPKQRYIGSVFKIFERISPDRNIFKVIYNENYASIEFDDAVIHAIPQCSSDEIFRHQLENVKKNTGKKNILMLHAGVTGMRAFSHGDSNELLLDTAYLEKNKFDYTALGHYHNFVQVAENAYFSGSTERMSFNEAGIPGKGFITVDLGESSTTTKFNEVETRKMLDKSIDCSEKDSVTISEEIKDLLNRIDPKNKIIRLTLKNIQSHILSSLDIKKIRELGSGATHFEPIFEKTDAIGGTIMIKSSIGSIREEFNLFIEGHPTLNAEEKISFKKEGGNLFDEINIP